MKTITEKKRIQSYDEKEVTMFQTEDGKKFNNEEEALKHEEYLKHQNYIFEKYKVKDHVDTDVYGLFYYDSISTSRLIYIDSIDEETENDLRWLYKSLKKEDIKLGWSFFVETEYDTCSYGGGYTLSVRSVSEVIEEREIELKKLREL